MAKVWHRQNVRSGAISERDTREVDHKSMNKILEAISIPQHMSLKSKQEMQKFLLCKVQLSFFPSTCAKAAAFDWDGQWVELPVFVPRSTYLPTPVTLALWCFLLLQHSQVFPLHICSFCLFQISYNPIRQACNLTPYKLALWSFPTPERTLCEHYLTRALLYRVDAVICFRVSGTARLVMRCAESSKQLCRQQALAHHLSTPTSNMLCRLANMVLAGHSRPPA